MTLSSSPGVTIRPAFSRHASPRGETWRDDAPALARLAALDSQRPLVGPVLLAEIDGEPWAAIALETGRVVADPFRPTAALVALLRSRAAQLAVAQEVAARPRADRGLARRRRGAAALDVSRPTPS
jgi:hypothetical protein